MITKEVNLRYSFYFQSIEYCLNLNVQLLYNQYNDPITVIGIVIQIQ